MSVYEIRVKGHLDKLWATWFEGLKLTYEGDNTMLRGTIADEAALHGVLTKLGNLNLHLLSVNTVETDRAAPDAPTPFGHAPVSLDAPHGEAVINHPAQKQKRKARTSRKQPPGHPAR